MQRRKVAPQRDSRLPASINSSHKTKGKKLKIVASCIVFSVILVLFALLTTQIVIFRSFQQEDFSLSSNNQHDQSPLLNEQGELITFQELGEAYRSLHQARIEKLSSFSTDLRPLDKEKYTVRMNTWRRKKQLLTSTKHLLSCPGVAQIQIIWCDKENEPPLDEIRNLNKNYRQTNPTTSYEKVIVEYHEKNSLNERFNILSKTPTMGILSIDDDVLRPCEAIDSGFFRWTDHPDRMVGFDYRLNEVTKEHHNQLNIDQNDVWKYGYLSTSAKRNRYSLTLPRFSFVHRDYLNLYIKYAPHRITTMVDENLNCEDIGISFFISALTGGRAPLLVDDWALKTLVKIESSTDDERNGGGGISQSHGHKKKRDECVDKFAFLLGLKDGYSTLFANTSNQLEGKGSPDIKWNPLQSEKIFHKGNGLGIDRDEQFQIRKDFVPRRRKFVEMIKSWKSTKGQAQKLHEHLKRKMHRLGF